MTHNLIKMGVGCSLGGHLGSLGGHLGPKSRQWPDFIDFWLDFVGGQIHQTFGHFLTSFSDGVFNGFVLDFSLLFEAFLDKK